MCLCQTVSSWRVWFLSLTFVSPVPINRFTIPKNYPEGSRLKQMWVLLFDRYMAPRDGCLEGPLYQALPSSGQDCRLLSAYPRQTLPRFPYAIINHVLLPHVTPKSWRAIRVIFHMVDKAFWQYDKTLSLVTHVPGNGGRKCIRWLTWLWWVPLTSVNKYVASNDMTICKAL